MVLATYFLSLKGTDPCDMHAHSFHYKSMVCIDQMNGVMRQAGKVKGKHEKVTRRIASQVVSNNTHR